MIQTHHLVISIIVVGSLLTSCQFQKKEESISDNLLCNVLNKLNVDKRLDQIPLLEEFKNGTKFKRLNNRPDSIPPLSVYIDTLKLKIENIKSLNQVYSFFDEKDLQVYELVKADLKLNCNDYTFINLSTNELKSISLAKEQAIFVQYSNIYKMENSNIAKIYVVVTTDVLDNTFGFEVDLVKKDEYWELKE
ncbi:hypothetical protein [Dokdonia sp. Hel_I_53]|uniref:hypothetical protein n=1 Tax=Dokdonia sp. Hel_I_53 TaxID=1566287 RepID=UPI001199A3D7|nr:hypothetical protein [Dokdonia sp. Hel_I_53]TVZ52689.1 hypothetical protein OD90_1873 [Dokdonia sp. Hel_I_53]